MSGSLPLNVPPFPPPLGENRWVFLILSFALYNRGQQMFSILKGQAVNISGCEGRSALCCCSTGATTDDA